MLATMTKEQGRQAADHFTYETGSFETSGQIRTWFEHDFQMIGWGLDQILSITGAHAGSAFLWDEKLKRLVLIRARGLFTGKQEELQLQLGQGIMGWVAQRGEAVWVEDIETDERFREILRRGRYQSHSFISVPLVFSNKLIGVLNITEKKNRTCFTREDLDRCIRWASCLALACEAFRAHQQIETGHTQGKIGLSIP